jgi:hypothetical protein
MRKCTPKLLVAQFAKCRATRISPRVHHIAVPLARTGSPELGDSFPEDTERVQGLRCGPELRSIED